MSPTTGPGTDPAASFAPPPPGAGSPLSRRQLLALACSIGLIPLNSTMIAVAIPAIARAVDAEPGSLIQWLVTSYLLVVVVVQSPAGKLGDRWGHARALALGQVVFALGSLAGFLAHGLPLLVAARVLMAVGGAIIVPGAMALVRVHLPEAQRARAFGLFGAVMSLSAALGPLVGGEVATRFGWPALFLVNILPLAIAGAMGRPGVRASSPSGAPSSPAAHVRPVRPRFDVFGSILLGVGLALIVIGARSPSIGPALVASGLATLGVFIGWERRVPDPVVDLRLFRRRAFAAGTLIIGLQNFAMYALLFELPVVFTRNFGATSAESGRALLGLTLAMVLGSILGGRAAGRFGPRNTALAGTLLALLGGLLLAARPLSGVIATLPALASLGLGVGLTTPSANAALMAMALPGESGMASGMASTVRYLGGIAGVAIVSNIVSGHDLVASQHRSALIFAAALAIAAMLAAVIPRHRQAGPA